MLYCRCCPLTQNNTLVAKSLLSPVGLRGIADFIFQTPAFLRPCPGLCDWWLYTGLTVQGGRQFTFFTYHHGRRIRFSIFFYLWAKWSSVCLLRLQISVDLFLMTAGWFLHRPLWLSVLNIVVQQINVWKWFFKKKAHSFSQQDCRAEKNQT